MKMITDNFSKMHKTLRTKKSILLKTTALTLSSQNLKNILTTKYNLKKSFKNKIFQYLNKSFRKLSNPGEVSKILNKYLVLRIRLQILSKLLSHIVFKIQKINCKLDNNSQGKYLMTARRKVIITIKGNLFN